MKHLRSVPFLAAIVLAQDSAYPIVPYDQLGDAAKPYAAAIIAVNESTIALDTSILAFTGFEHVGDLTRASTNLLQAIRDGAAAIAPLPAFPNDNITDASDFGTYVVNFGYYVNLTVFDLVSKKQLFEDICIGPVVLQQIELQSSAAVELQSSLFAKIPPDLLDIATTIASPITEALSSGVAAFADQSTTPASCAATTTVDSTTVDSTTTAVSMTSTSGTHSTIIATYGTGGQSGHSTAGYTGYVTTSHSGPSTHPTKPASQDDCENEDDEGENTSTTALATTPHVVWEVQSSFGPNSASQSYSVSSGIADWSIITSEPVHPHPHSTLASSAPSVQTMNPPSGIHSTTTSQIGVYTTSPYSPYHGTATANHAAGLCAVAVAAFFAAVLL